MEREPKIFETGNELEHFVTKIRTEDAGGGNVRISAFRVIHGTQWHLADSWIVPESELTEMGRQLLCAGAQAHGLTKGKFTQ